MFRLEELTDDHPLATNWLPGISVFDGPPTPDGKPDFVGLRHLPNLVKAAMIKFIYTARAIERRGNDVVLQMDSPFDVFSIDDVKQLCEDCGWRLTTFATRVTGKGMSEQMHEHTCHCTWMGDADADTIPVAFGKRLRWHEGDKVYKLETVGEAA